MTSTAWPAKDPSESLVCDFDFTPELDPSETISNAVVSNTLLSGSDPNPAAMLFAAATIVAGVVLQPFRAGVHNALYKLRCEVTLAPTGRVLVLTATLPVRTA